jgi:hypothetical protein
VSGKKRKRVAAMSEAGSSINTTEQDSGRKDSGSDESRREAVRVSPHNQLSRSALAFAFAVMIAVGLAVYAVFPESVGGPPLPVTVSVEEAPVETINGQFAVMTEVIRVTNTSEGPIGNLTVEINGQYLMTQASPLSAGESIVLPQQVFTDKRSSQRFDPGSTDVDEVVVTGQLPSKSRGVSQFEFAE